MEIRQLKYFIAVAEELNFRRAAERLFISQPPLSRQIKQLEEQLGIELFQREKKRLHLTLAGKTLFSEAQDLLTYFNQVEQNVKAIGTGKKGAIKVTFLISGMMRFLPKGLPEFKSKYPDINISLSETAGTNRIIEDLINKKVDVAFSYGINKDPRIVSKVLFEEQILYAIPIDHKLANCATISLKQLKNQDLIFFHRDLDPKWYDWFSIKCREQGFTPKIVHHAQPMQNRLNMVTHGMGITFVSESLTTREISGVQFIYPDENERLSLSVTVSHRKETTSLVVRKFLETFNLC